MGKNTAGVVRQVSLIRSMLTVLQILGGSFPTVTAEKLSKHFCSTCTLVACILAVILLSYRTELNAFGHSEKLSKCFRVDMCVILCTPYISHMVC